MRPLNRELMLNPMKNGEIIYFRFLKAQHIFYLCLALTRATIQKKTHIARMQRKRSGVHNNFMYTFPWSDVLASFGNEEIVQNFN